MILFCRQQWQKCIENWKGQKKKFTSFHVGGYIYMVKTDLNPVQGYIELFHFKLFFFSFSICIKEGLHWKRFNGLPVATLLICNTWPVQLVDFTGRGFIQINVTFSTVLDETNFWIKGKMVFCMQHDSFGPWDQNVMPYVDRLSLFWS